MPLGAISTAGAAPVGIASHITGAAEVRSGEGAWKPLRLLQRLESGDKVRCGSGAEVTVVLFDSATRYKVDAGATGVIGSHGVQGGHPATGLPGPGIRIAKAMVGSRMDAFVARPAQSHQRLTPQSPGWIAEGERHFEWPAQPGAATYSFTLFDANDNVVWSARATAPAADYPADLPFFTLRRPYLWRLVAFGSSGKPLTGARWGLLTFLSREDAGQLTSEAQALEEAANADPSDVTPRVLLAELYRGYGVLEKTLEVLESPQLANQPGIQELQEEVYQQASRYAQLLRPGKE
jgi:hypothetical protein